MKKIECNNNNKTKKRDHVDVVVEQYTVSTHSIGSIMASTREKAETSRLLSEDLPTSYQNAREAYSNVDTELSR
jgi:hypothetical protein